jgi:hypothetical protein
MFYLMLHSAGKVISELQWNCSYSYEHWGLSLFCLVIFIFNVSNIFSYVVFQNSKFINYHFLQIECYYLIFDRSAINTSNVKIKNKETD